MPIGPYTVPAYLQTNPNQGIENYLRSKQIVDQRQAQIAQEKHQQDQLALQAQAQAQQAAIHQQELGLRQQAQKAAVDTAAQRLQFSQQQEGARQQEAAAEQAYQNAPAEVLSAEGMPSAYRSRGHVYFPPGGGVNALRPGEVSRLGTAREMRDAEGNLLGNLGFTHENSGVFIPKPKTGASPEERAAQNLEEKNRFAADKLDTNLALRDRDSAEKVLSDPSARIRLSPADQTSLSNKLERANVILEGKRRPAAKAAPKAATQGVRIKRKSDGKTFSYGGNPADVPSEYEILK